jgi:hypothetical protein
MAGIDVHARRGRGGDVVEAVDVDVDGVGAVAVGRLEVHPALEDTNRAGGQTAGEVEAPPVAAAALDLAAGGRVELEHLHAGGEGGVVARLLVFAGQAVIEQARGGAAGGAVALFSGVDDLIAALKAVEGDVDQRAVDDARRELAEVLDAEDEGAGPELCVDE